MLHKVDLDSVSDGKIYTLHDLARLGTNGCAGCCECCYGREDSITLDLYDIWRLTTGLALPFSELLKTSLQLTKRGEISEVSLKTDPRTGACVFLNEEGWCQIHPLRPDLCRIFPLARMKGEDGGCRYILQIHECDRCASKVRVEKWISEEDIQRHEAFAAEWLTYQQEAEAAMGQIILDRKRRHLNMQLLQTGYLPPFLKEDPWGQAEERLAKMRGLLKEAVQRPEIS